MAMGSLTQTDASPGIVAVGDELQSLAARLGIAWAPIRPEHGTAQLWPGRPWAVFAFGVAFSVGTEVYQGLAPFLGRSPDPFDVLADLIGLVTGMAVAWLVARGRPQVPA